MIGYQSFGNLWVKLKVFFLVQPLLVGYSTRFFQIMVFASHPINWEKPERLHFLYFLLPVIKFGNYFSAHSVCLCFYVDQVRWFLLLTSVQVWQVRSVIISFLPRIRFLICFAIIQG